MNPKLFLPALAFLCFTISCNQSSKGKEALTSSNSEMKDPLLQHDKQEDQKQPVGSPGQVTQDTATTAAVAQTVAHIDWDKKIIKTATVKLEVTDFKKYSDAIHKAVRQYGGYIAGEEQHLQDERSETVISIKVPVDQFEAMMNGLPLADSKLIERSITTQDVTGEVIDIRSRLEAKKQMRLKYIEFLKSSKNMEEVLKVQSEINGIQEQIEAASGRVDYLSHQSAYSTINLTFYQLVPGFKPVDNASPSFFVRLGNAFKTGSDWIADLFVALVSIWPLLLIGMGAYFIFRKAKLFKSHPQNP